MSAPNQDLITKFILRLKDLHKRIPDRNERIRYVLLAIYSGGIPHTEIPNILAMSIVDVLELLGKTSDELDSYKNALEVKWTELPTKTQNYEWN